MNTLLSSRTGAAALGLSCAFLLAACGDKEVDEDDDWGLGDDTSEAQCGSTYGFVSGIVTGPYDPEPNPWATVSAYNPETEQFATAEMDGAGGYELNLEGGSWSVYGSDGICFSDDTPIDVEACEEYVVDIELIDCDTADKPNLYLYPEVDTPMAVRVHTTNRQHMVASAPEHGDRGWRGVAHPDGTFSVDGERWPFLFYEVSLAPWQSRSFQRSEGWCLAEEGAVDAMAELLGDYGFNAGERDDFVDAWIHDLPPNRGGYAVYPQHRVAHTAGLELSRALPIERLWLVVEDGAGCTALPEPVVLPMERRGAHGVEWGVVLHDLVR